MVWKSLPETHALLSAHDTERVRALYSLSRLLQYAFLTGDYDVSAKWSQVIVLSDDAADFLATHDRLRDDYKHHELALAAFVDFFHHNLWIDTERTDIDVARDLVDSELRSGAIRLPHRFGRLLYDRFNDSAPQTRTEHLEYEEAEELLRDTPQGVYQVGYFVTGPLGIISSADLRYMPPSQHLPLWHCSDTGCRALHQVGLRPPAVPIVAALHALRATAEAELGPVSEWSRLLSDLCRPQAIRRVRRYYDLPAVLAEALTEEERHHLLTALLTSENGGMLRDIVAKKMGSSMAKGAPADVANRLDDVTRLQLLLSLPTQEIVRAVDRGIASSGIRIPLYETRTPNLRPPRAGDRDLDSAVAVFGIRATHPQPLLQTTVAIWEAYADTDNLEELGWRLRRRAGRPPRSALSEYMQRVTPGDAIRELVLPSMPITVALGERLGIEIHSEVDSPAVVDRMLWKLGFNPPRYETDCQQLRERIQQFTDTLLRVGSVRSERDREVIRSAGVNLFVSVESFVEQLVSYNVWLLASDHFLDTDFAYDKSYALASVGRVLGNPLQVEDAEFSWNPDGGNTLGTSLLFGQQAAKWMSSLSSMERAAVARPHEDLPHFAGDQERVFRFRHAQLWGDADPDGLDAYAEGFGGVMRHLNQANIASVRNGLDHQREPDDFPTLEAMLACAARLRQALDLADLHRYVPKTFWLKSRRADLFGRTEHVLEDYQGRAVTASGPSVAVPLVSLRFSEPYLVAPGDLLADVGAQLRFRIKERSAHSRYWEQYPRRRRISSPHQLPAPDGGGEDPVNL